MNKIFKVNAKNANFTNHSKFHKEGFTLICETCGSELSVALSLDEANKKGIIPGIYCPKDGKHIYIHIYTQEARERMKDKIWKKSE